MSSLKSALDRLYLDFNRVDSAADPVHVVRRYPDPADREVVGFCAAALAFGRVASVLASVETLLAEMGSAPARFVKRFDPARHRAAFRTLGHRWTRGLDLAALLWILRRMLETEGSIEAFFLKGYEAGAEDIGPALDSFCERALSFDLDGVYGRRRGGGARNAAAALGCPVRTVHYFFPQPSSGSGCKRLNLFLRWMVRRDRIDLGVWSRVSAARLIIPLDTHVIRVAQCLGLTRYRSPGWKMAREITASLRALDPADPVKYDFSLCHLGMLNVCGFRAPRRGGRVGDPARRPQRDANCPLRGLCHWNGTRAAVHRPQSSRRSSARR